MKTIHPTTEQIRVRAYQLFLERGGEPGHDLDDWLQAEYELMQLPIAKLATVAPPRSNASRVARQGLSVVALVQAALFLATDVLPRLPQ